jgi:alpha-galactosidase
MLWNSNGLSPMHIGLEFACLTVIVAGILNPSAMSQDRSHPSDDCKQHRSEVTAQYTTREIPLNAAHPAPEWSTAQAISFCSDWRGQNADPERQTQVRILWNKQTLYLRFECGFRSLYTFDDSDASGRRDHLWDRDVAEVFLQPDATRERFYKEIEVAPNGMWIDLDVSPGPLQDLKSGMTRSVSIDDKRSIWAAEIAIPIKALTAKFNPEVTWRANFFRIEGQKEPRTYLAWRPTNTPSPNFHVPSAFGKLHFARASDGK